MSEASSPGPPPPTLPTELAVRVPRLLEAMRSVGSGLEQPVRLADLTRDPRSCGFPEHHPWMRSFLGLPIRVQGEIFGNLYLTEKRGDGPFNDDDLDMVRVLATEAGNARLYEAAKQRERWIDGPVAVTTALLSGGEACRVAGRRQSAQDGHREGRRRHDGGVGGTARRRSDP